MRYVLIFLTIYTGLFLSMPRLDLILAEHTYSAEAGFIYANHPLVRGIYQLVYGLSTALITTLLVLFIWKKLFKEKKLFRFSVPPLAITGYLLACVIIGPGIIVHNVLKEGFERPRPRQVQELGGQLTYTPPLTITDQGGKSFPSGHSSMGFFLLCFALLAQRKKLKVALYSGGIVLGCLTGLGRMLQGGHFFSDVLFSMIVVMLTAHLLYPFFFKPEKES